MRFYFLAADPREYPKNLADDHFEEVIDHLLRSAASAQLYLQDAYRVLALWEKMLGNKGLPGFSKQTRERYQRLEQDCAKASPLDDELSQWLRVDRAQWTWGHQCLSYLVNEYLTRRRTLHPTATLAHNLLSGLDPGDVGQSRTARLEGINLLVARDRAQYFDDFYGKVLWKRRPTPSWWSLRAQRRTFTPDRPPR